MSSQQPSILVVDDESGILQTLRILLTKSGFDVRTAQGGKTGLEAIQSAPPDVVLSDVRMPQVGGLEILQAAHAQDPETPVILMTAQASLQTAIQAVNDGAFYYIQKPFSNDDMVAICARALETRQLRSENRALKSEIRRLNQVSREQNFRLQDMNRTLEHKVRDRTHQLADKHRELRQAYVQTVGALADAIDAKDAYTRGHSERVGVYSSKLAREMSFSEEFIERVYIAGLLHDVGKIGIPDAVILKPEKLDPDEYEQIKRHPAIGAKILERVDFLQDVAPCVRHHHEWFDGSSRGYPDGLAGNRIPLPSRLILVCDTIEAMTSDRPYRKAMPFERVFDELTKFSGSQFDPNCVTAMLRLLEREGPDFIRKDQSFDIYEFIES